MTRTTLCLLTALGLVLTAGAIATTRIAVLGNEARFPLGRHTYRVTLLVRGTAQKDARLVTACPLDFPHQHVFGEEMHSSQLVAKHADARAGTRRQLHWRPRTPGTEGPFVARYLFHCNVDTHHAAASERRLAAFDVAPGPGEYLGSSPGIDPSLPAIAEAARALTAGLDTPLEQVHALFHFVDEEIQNEPVAGPRSPTALECLETRAGGALGQSRLLVALCRNRGIPARLVWGLVLHQGSEQKAHAWLEAWVGDRWVALCPFHHHYATLPAGYLVFGHGEPAPAHGSHVRDLEHAFLVEHLPHSADADGEASLLRRVFRRLSLYTLPPAEERLVEFLLLLPVAALIVCFFRNIVGLATFGTFTPALIGLAFRKLESLPGLAVFVAILLLGWGMRRVLDRYQLLQVPRTAFMLSLVVVLLVGAIVAANLRHVPATHYVALFPMVILTGMIERFWTLESEDGAWHSFRTLGATLLAALSISLILSLCALVKWLLRFPETLGVVMACQLLLGRYTGYRLSELWRFRDLATAAAHPPYQAPHGVVANVDTLPFPVRMD